MIKSNPYVYPYTPFKNLGNKNFLSHFESKTVSTKYVLNTLDSLPKLKVNAVGDTTEEKILSIFLDDEILFGPKEYVLGERKLWLTKILYFVKKGVPIEMTILGFPFKIPVPLKTDRTLPDMGEVLCLKRLDELNKLIQAIYPPGARITIVTEGIFGSFNYMAKKEYKNYEKFLKKLAVLLELDKTIDFTALEDMEKLDKKFTANYKAKVMEFEKLVDEGDPNITKKYQGAMDSMLRIVNTRDFGFNKKSLMEAYNFRKKNVSLEADRIRKHINKILPGMIIKYLAYLSMRDELRFLQKAFPGALNLTVSPKPGRLGIIPVAKNVYRLPYHSVPVKKGNYFTLEYLIDIERTGKKYIKIFWDKDGEHKPFFYEEL